MKYLLLASVLAMGCISGAHAEWYSGFSGDKNCMPMETIHIKNSPTFRTPQQFYSYMKGLGAILTITSDTPEGTFMFESAAQYGLDKKTFVFFQDHEWCMRTMTMLNNREK